MLADFRRWLESREGMQVQPSTADGYLRIARRFTDKYGDPATITDEDLRRWEEEVEYPPDKPRRAPSTVNMYISAIKALFRYAVARGIREDNPVEDVQLAKRPERKPRPLAREVLDKIYLRVVEAADLQDIAILEVLYGSGVRVEEAGNLMLGSITQRKYLRVIGKGDKERHTILPHAAYVAVRDWVLHAHGDERTHSIREEISEDAAFDDLQRRYPDKGVFVTRRGREVRTLRYPGGYIWKRMRPYLEDLGVTPHQFRHTFATHLLMEGANPYHVSLMLGHSNMNTIRIYDGADQEVFHQALQIHPRTREVAHGGA